MSILFHLLFAYIIGKLFSLNIPYILFGAITPDFDYIVWQIVNFGKNRTDSYHHRFYFHNLFFIITAAFLPLIIFIGVVLHIFLDFFDSYGVPIFYPFNKRHFLIKKISDSVGKPLYVVLIYGNPYLFIILSILSFYLLFFF